MEKNMAKIIKFVCSMILYLSLFLVTMKVGSEDICEADEDCPQSDNVFYVIKCIGNKCEESTKHF
ncbi:unnamed protein product [Lathyrus oleraceus]